MRRTVKSTITFLCAIVGAIGGAIWAYKTNLDVEPIILCIVSVIEILGFFIVSDSKEEAITITEKSNNNRNEQQVNVNVNVGNNSGEDHLKQSSQVPYTENRDAQIEAMKPRTQILFIDDDKNFNVVRILKDSGWKNTKTVVDIKSLDIPIVKETDIYFVDINGVGKLLNLEFGGLDLALMLKQKYPTKKVVIYSANKNSNSFHRAWEICDFKLEKNALPYQFQNIVEQYSLELFSLNK